MTNFRTVSGHWRGERSLAGAVGEVQQQFVTVETRTVAVAEIEPDRIITNAFPVEHDHAGKIILISTAMALAEDVFFAALLCAGRSGPEFFHLEKGFGAVVPGDGDFGADELDVCRCFQSRKERQASERL